MQRYNQRNYAHSIDEIDFLNIFSEKGLDISEEKDSSNYVLIKGGSESITEINYNDNLDYFKKFLNLIIHYLLRH